MLTSCLFLIADANLFKDAFEDAKSRNKALFKTAAVAKEEEEKKEE